MAQPHVMTHVEGETRASDPVLIGGRWWFAHYAEFYFEAADRLTAAVSSRTLEIVAVPVLYLQRHCVELIIKDLILGCFHVDEAGEIAGENGPRIGPPDFDHDFETLLTDLTDAIAVIGYADASELDGLRTLAARLSAIEAGSAERFRYIYVRKFKNRTAPPASFERVTPIPLLDLQEELTRVFRSCDDIKDPKSLISQLYDEAGVLTIRAFQSGGLLLDDIPEAPLDSGPPETGK
jgi:hypothetical protein